MRFTWVPQLGRHVIWQYSKSLTYLIVLLALTIGAPYVLAHLIPLRDPSQIDHLQMLLWVAFIGGGCVGLSVFWNESSSTSLMELSQIYDPPQSRLFTALADLRKVARVEWPVHIVVHTYLLGTAALIRTRFQHADHVIHMSKRLEQNLEPDELDAVIAHELAHVRHGDFITVPILLISFAAFTYTLLTYIFLLSIMFEPVPTSGFPVAVLLCLASWFTFRFLMWAHSRTREYLADAAVLAFLGYDQREVFVRALLKTVHIFSPRIDIFDDDADIVRSHPTVVRRARALGVHITEKDWYIFVFGTKKID